MAKAETIDAHLNNILPKFKAMNLTGVFPGKLHHGTRKPYREMYYDIPQSILQPVMDKYQADADMFGYTFDKYDLTKIITKFKHPKKCRLKKKPDPNFGMAI